MRYAHEREDGAKVDQAYTCILQGDFSGAARLLGEVIAHTPDEYVHQFVEDDTLCIRFWNDAEFAHYVTWQISQGNPPSQNIARVRSVYPMAFFYLGVIFVEMNHLEDALRMLALGARLEPSNPRFAVETAQVLLKMKRYHDALAALEPFEEIGLYVTAASLARVLRTKGVALIELNELGHAEEQFRRSLQYEPGNEVALKELEYIAHLRAGGAPITLGQSLTQPTRFDPSVCSICGESGDESGDEIRILNIDGVMYAICARCARDSDEK